MDSVSIRQECECGHQRDDHRDDRCHQPGCTCHRYDQKISFSPSVPQRESLPRGSFGD